MALFQLTAQAQSAQTTVRLTPNLIQLTHQSNQTVVMAVEVESVSNLNAIDLALRYDPNLVEVVDADPTMIGTQVAVGNALSNGKFFAAVNQVSDGRIEFAGTFVAGEQPFSGQGTLVEISWRAKSRGQANLSLTKAILVDSANTSITTVTQDAQLLVGTPIKLVGQVQRQGATDHSGITITSATQQVTTTADGRFSFDGLTPYVLTLTAPKYLRMVVQGEAASAELTTVDVGLITLLAGDLNQDGKIDIFDISLLGNQYNSSEVDSDLTGDGKVDIFDLSLAAANFGQPKLAQ